MQWYYALAGQQFGPLSLEELQKLASSGVVQSDTLVWKLGMPNWIPASQVPDITLPISKTLNPSLPPVSSPYAPPQSSNTQSAYNYQGEQVSNTGPLVVSIIVTILTFLACCIPLGVVGIVFAAMIPSKVRLGDVKGAKSYAKISYICSIATIMIVVVYFAFMILLAFAGGIR